MTIQENVPIGRKTTMRIGGNARYYAVLASKQEVEEAWKFAQEKNVPMFVLGGGSNTIFADGTIEALVVQIKHDEMTVETDRVTVGAGAYLATVIMKLADQGLDLSALTGIPGTIGGAIFGNAGQGPKGVWIDAYVDTVTIFIDGEWKTMRKNECEFAYRESGFKHYEKSGSKLSVPIIWEVSLMVPKNKPDAIKGMIEQLLKRRIETQPHVKTAGSCFKAVGDVPAWQLINAVGLRGKRIGGVEISEKHANFLINADKATYADTKALINLVKTTIADPLDVEMRLVETDGTLAF